MFSKIIPWKKRSGEIKTPNEDHPIAQLRHDFDQLWDRFWNAWRQGELSLWDDSRWLGSRIDFDDSEREYVLRAEVPGFEPEDFDVKVSGNVLTLRAEHREKGKSKKGNGSYQRYGSFYESFTLPREVLSDKINARYHSGVLEVHLPKSEECQPKRIEVKSA